MAYQYEAGFIGAGNMGGALARAAVKTVGGAAVAVACSTAEHSAKAAASIGCAAETAEAIRKLAPTLERKQVRRYDSHA